MVKEDFLRNPLGDEMTVKLTQTFKNVTLIHFVENLCICMIEWYQFKDISPAYGLKRKQDSIEGKRYPKHYKNSQQGKNHT